MKAAVLAYSKLHPEGKRLADIARDCGLELNHAKFTRVLGADILSELVADGKIRKEGNLYFPVD